MELTWHDVSIEEDNYILERSSDGVSFQTIATLPANTETYTDTDLQQENYFYRLKATNTIGTSPASNTVQSEDYQTETQNIIYVSETGAGTFDGSSEANAYGNFGTALGQITSGGDKLIIIGTINLSLGVNLTNKSFAFTIEGLDANSIITGASGDKRLFTINGATLANVTFKDLTFSGNSTTLAGGSVLFNNAAGASVTFNNCTLTDNSVSNGAGGGALFFANGNLNIIDSSFENNTSIEEAGAIFGQSGIITITNSLFKSNSAATKGGALYARYMQISP